MTQVQRLILPGILVLVAVLYGGVLYNDFVWDDKVLFVDNAALRTGSIDWAMLSRPVMEGSNYFRPLVLLTWALEVRVWGVNPFAAHAVNLGLHLLNVALLFLLAQRVLSSLDLDSVPWRAGLAATLYALHPSLVEVTSWVSGRFDLMVTAFILAALLIDTTTLGRWSRAAWTSLLFALALGSKELALMFPPILLAMRLVRIHRSGTQSPLWRDALAILRADAPTVIGLAAVFVGWFLLRADVLGMALSTAKITAGQPPAVVFMLHALLVLNTVWFYAGQIVVPFANVSPLHPLEFDLLNQPTGLLRAAAGAGVLAALAALMVRHRIQGLLLACVVLALLPVLQIVPLTSSAESIGADRFLTLPLCFAAITLSTLAFPFATRLGERLQVIGVSVLGGAWLLLGAITITGVIPMWRSELVLWSWMYEKHPEAQFAQRSYIHTAMRHGLYEQAGEVFDRLRARGPLHSTLQIQYGTYLQQIGDTAEAENYIKGGLLAYGIEYGAPQPDRRYTDNPDDRYIEATITERLILAYAYNTMAEIERLRGHHAEAIHNIDEAIRYLPHIPAYAAVRGLLLIADERDEEGEQAYREAYERMAPADRIAASKLRKRFLDDLCLERSNSVRPACDQYRLPTSAEETSFPSNQGSTREKAILDRSLSPP